jgi:glycosyltransferase involved in cell wall biosynthesis
VALAHDYLTQRGGAERAVLSMLEAFPGAPLHTTLFEPAGTFPEFVDADIRTSWLNDVPFFRRSHRAALPFLAAAVGSLDVGEVDMVVCSSTGWAHGIRTPPGARKLVYCNTPARWLYRRDEYLPGRGVGAAALTVLRRPLERWDRRAAASADLYVANSRNIAARIEAVYGWSPGAIIHPPHRPITAQPRAPEGVEPGAFLVVSRLLPYKNVEPVVEAFRSLPHERLVVIGDGPLRPELAQKAPGNVRFLGSVDDHELAWSYEHCRGHIAVAFEDFGITPLEAAAKGRPSVLLRAGGFLETSIDGLTCVFVDVPTPEAVALGVRELLRRDWDRTAMQEHVRKFGEDRFVRELQDAVAGAQARSS